MLIKCRFKDKTSSKALIFITFWAISAFFFNQIAFSQQEKTITKVFPLTFNEDNASNKLWVNPLNILDGDTTTFSYPKTCFKLDDDGYYYVLMLQRPFDANGRLLDKNDYGTIIRVQVQLVYGLFEGIGLTRFSSIEFEGYNRRLDNIEIPGINVEEKVTEIADITDAVSDWNFSNEQQWDELLLRFSTKYDISDEQLFHLYDIQLLITYIKK